MRFLCAVLLIAGLNTIGKAQPPLMEIKAYWGEVSTLKVPASQLNQIEYIKILDTVKGREIKYISRYRLYYQPVDYGPVKVMDGHGIFISSQLKSIPNPKPGDKIILSDIYGYVNTEGFKQIPTAVVMHIL